MVWSCGALEHTHTHTNYCFFVFSPSLLPQPHPTSSPILLGSGALSLEPVRHREEAVAHWHRDQSYDLWPLPDPSEAQHRRTQGNRCHHLDDLTSVFGWMNVSEHILRGLIHAVSLDAFRPMFGDIKRYVKSGTVLHWQHWALIYHSGWEQNRTYSLNQDAGKLLSDREYELFIHIRRL